MKLKIWVDADACPAVIKEILYKAAESKKIKVTLAANNHFRIPKSSFIHFLQVPHGQDGADNRIADKSASGDLVITSDIALAARIVEKRGLALNPHGEVYSEDTIKEKLSIGGFLNNMRSGGVDTGGSSALSPRDRQAFENRLDRLLSKCLNRHNQSVCRI